MAIRFRAAYVSDLEEAYAFLEQRSPRAAERLLARVEHVVGLIDDFPMIGRRRDDLGPGLHSMRLRGFPYLVFYRSDEGGVVVERLLYGARRLTWRLFLD